MIDQVKAAFIGAAIGDALGVPVEFMSRAALSRNPVTDYRGYGVWHQPPGTFSDDSSLLFCTAESLCTGYDVADIANRFVRWYQQGYWGAHDEVFDIGGATRTALTRVINGTSPTLSGGLLEQDNGNGSLMRILPVAFYLCNEPSMQTRFDTVRALSAITHGHFRSVMACFVYVELAIQLLTDPDIPAAYARMQTRVNDFIAENAFSPTEIRLFDRILQADLSHLDEPAIRSSGYVMDTLESSLWCLLTTRSFEEAVLKAVNLGDDTDTTGTVTGGLAGLAYGYEAIPTHWVYSLAKQEAIEKLAERFAGRYA
ncbi:ADP-ribosylglycohydrolase family protein [Fibrisoma montanum]|uniref:ADP-ribosylglycohydrolase family protein n=1 Tax=Fibrisoma montanum TaxID=2305895 RepID=A0A418M240_9BACT|nr:ADP-ribosylglycohydrolase family protein [Fibrisoma montanum]RIV19781.1 ADP-ribosylglycohydrolase family protein [Fibrisoma montanum]